MGDGPHDAFITDRSGDTPRKYSSGHLLIGDSINGMNFTMRHKQVTKTTNRRTKRLMNLGDTCVSILIISPLAIANWRGTWSFMDHQKEFFPPWSCLLVGALLHTIFALLREYLHMQFSRPSNGNKSWRRTMLRHVVTKLYTYIFSIACIMHWRGGWAVLTEYFGKELLTGITKAKLEIWKWKFIKVSY